MFDILKNIFNLNHSRSNSDQTLAHHNPNILSDREEILSLLLNIKAGAPTCTVFLDDRKETYTSEIVEINAIDNTILLDEFRPEHGNSQLQKCKNVKVLFFYNGEKVFFNLAKPMQTEVTDYRFPIPGRVYYPQNKPNLRVLDVHSLKIPFDGFSASNRLPVSGHVNELAETSISTYITTHKATLECYDLLKECHIILPDNKYVVTFDLIVNFIKKPIAKNAKTFLSGHIKNMSAPDRIQYERFMVLIERQELKKRKY